MTRLGVVAIGSNATRMLTADAVPGLPNEIRMREETRLFRGLNERGELCADVMRITADAVARLHEKALFSGALRAQVFATSATRDARNANEFADMIEALCGEKLCVISGEEEAALSFLGAVGADECGVVDIGGGSTEICVGCCGVLRAAVSAQMGAARLLREYRADGERNAREAAAYAKAAILNALAALDCQTLPCDWRLVGGTGTTLAAMCQGMPHELAMPEGHVLAKDVVLDWLMRMARMTQAEKLQIVGMPPSRADIMPTGLCVLLAVMEALRIEKITVTKRGNCDGWLLREMARAQAAQ